MKFDVYNRFTGKVQFTAKIDCAEDAATSVKLGLAVKWAIKTGASLTDAYLADVNLYGANLYGANLTGACLIRANLYGACLIRANLYGANLYGANLYGANLTGADLTGADLTGACLTDAYLADVKAFGYTFNRSPIQIDDKYFIHLWDGFLKIGCEEHPIAEWLSFSDDDISEMDDGALDWWKVWKPILMGMAEATGRKNLPMKGEK